MEMDIKGKTEELTNMLIAKGYYIDCINQIIKGYENGFKDIISINIDVDKDDIRILNNLFNKFYKDKTDITQMHILIEAANDHLLIDPLINKKHDADFLKQLYKDIKNNKDYTLYINDKDKPDLSINKVNFLTTLRDNEQYNKYTKEDIDKIKIILDNRELSSKLKNIILTTDNSEILDYLKDGYAVDLCETYVEINKYHPEALEMFKSVKNLDRLNLLWRKYCNDPDLINCLVNKTNINKFSNNELKKMFESIENNNLDYEKILNKDISNDAKFNLILFAAQGGNIELAEKFEKYDVFDDCSYGFEQLIDRLNDADEELLNIILKELETNDQMCISDIKLIEDGYKNGIDISLYMPQEDIEYDVTEKEFLLELLKYNKRNPDNQIKIEDIMDENSKEIDINYYNIETITEAFRSNINLMSLRDLDTDKLDCALDAIEKFKLPQDKIELMTKYLDLIEEDTDAAFIVKLLNSDYQITNTHDIYKNSVNIYKKLDNLKSYNDFCRNIIDEKLTEENCEKLINILSIYTKSKPEIQPIYEKVIESGHYVEINPSLSNDRIEIILNDLIDGITLKPYMSNEYSIEQIKKYSEINHILNNMNTKFYDLDSSEPKLYNKDYTIEQLDFIENKIKSGKIQKDILNPEYSADAMSFYSDCYDKIWIYDFYIFNQNEKLCDLITKQYRESFRNLDKNLPLNEQIEQMKSTEKKILENAAESADMDMKLYIYGIVKKIDSIEKNIDEIER